MPWRIRKESYKSWKPHIFPVKNGHLIEYPFSDTIFCAIGQHPDRELCTQHLGHPRNGKKGLSVFEVTKSQKTWELPQQNHGWRPKDSVIFIWLILMLLKINPFPWSESDEIALPQFASQEAPMIEAPFRYSHTLMFEAQVILVLCMGSDRGTGLPSLQRRVDPCWPIPSSWGTLQFSSKCSSNFPYFHQAVYWGTLIELPRKVCHSTTFWVNYNISLTWILRPFGDDFPYTNLWFPGFARSELVMKFTQTTPLTGEAPAMKNRGLWRIGEKNTIAISGRQFSWENEDKTTGKKSGLLYFFWRNNLRGFLSCIFLIISRGFPMFDLWKYSGQKGATDFGEIWYPWPQVYQNINHSLW